MIDQAHNPPQGGNGDSLKPAADAQETKAPDLSQRKKGRGRIISVQGPIVDVYFDDIDDIPALYDQIEVYTYTKKRVVLQCAEHLSTHNVRTIALQDTLKSKWGKRCNLVTTFCKSRFIDPH